jgi:hypothetical protein
MALEVPTLECRRLRVFALQYNGGVSTGPFTTVAQPNLTFRYRIQRAAVGQALGTSVDERDYVP